MIDFNRRGAVWRSVASKFATLAVIGLAVGTADTALAQTPLPAAKPVPKTQVTPLPYDRAKVTHQGRKLFTYHFGRGLKRPFYYPIAGPSGRSLTRMGHPRDPKSHSHHNSVWISHHDVGGVNFWSDGGKGRIVHRRVLGYEDHDDWALIAVENAWRGGDGRDLLIERRIMQARPLPHGEWLLVIDMEFRPAGKPVTLGTTAFGMIGVRMAKTIGVRDGGGLIRNSAGQKNEKEVFRKPARWVDYSGPIATAASGATIVEGITLMDHPQNPGHPTAFHVRDDGWMGASLTLSAPLEITRHKPLHLRYGLYIHRGAPPARTIDEKHQEFAGVKLPTLAGK